MENGMWKLRHYYEDGHVEINERCPEYLLEYEGRKKTKQFSRLLYERMEQVIYEVLMSYLELTVRRMFSARPCMDCMGSFWGKRLERKK